VAGLVVVVTGVTAMAAASAAMELEVVVVGHDRFVLSGTRTQSRVIAELPRCVNDISLLFSMQAKQ
jgi:precorrin-2 methylase